MCGSITEQMRKKVTQLNLETKEQNCTHIEDNKLYFTFANHQKPSIFLISDRFRQIEAARPLYDARSS